MPRRSCFSPSPPSRAKPAQAAAGRVSANRTATTLSGTGTLAAGTYRAVFNTALFPRNNGAAVDLDQMVSGQLDLGPATGDASVAPLPAAVWGGFALLGGLGLKRLRRGNGGIA